MQEQLLEGHRARSRQMPFALRVFLTVMCKCINLVWIQNAPCKAQVSGIARYQAILSSHRSLTAKEKHRKKPLFALN
jgi:hypothetical protein